MAKWRAQGPKGVAYVSGCPNGGKRFGLDLTFIPLSMVLRAETYSSSSFTEY